MTTDLYHEMADHGLLRPQDKIELLIKQPDLVVNLILFNRPDSVPWSKAKSGKSTSKKGTAA